MINVFDYPTEGELDEHEMEIVCDGCGCRFCDSDGNERWMCKDKSDAEKNVAYGVREDSSYVDYGWNYTDDGRDFCPRCAHHSDELDKLIEHPVPKKIRNITEAVIRLRDSVSAEEISSGKIALPVDFVRTIKGMLYQYAVMATIANAEYYEAKTICDDYDNDVNESRSFYENDCSTRDMLHMSIDALENIIGNYQDGK